MEFFGTKDRIYKEEKRMDDVKNLDFNSDQQLLSYILQDTSLAYKYVVWGQSITNAPLNGEQTKPNKHAGRPLLYWILFQFKQ